MAFPGLYAWLDEDTRKKRAEQLSIGGEPGQLQVRWRPVGGEWTAWHGGVKEKVRGIGGQVYYPRPLHLQPCLAYLGYSKEDFPVAEQAADEVLSLPMYPQLPVSGQEQVAVAIREFFSSE